MRVLFSAEMGGGWGHIAKVIPLAERMVQLGHEVLVSTNHTCPRTTSIRQVPAPLQVRCPFVPRNATYASRMKFWGEDKVDRRWFYREMFASFGPDLVVINHSPFAHQAACEAGLPTVHITEGYECPLDYPFPANRTLFATFPEFDCYGPRRVEYIGPIGKILERATDEGDDVFYYVREPQKFGRERNSVYSRKTPSRCITHGVGTAAYWLLKGIPVEIVDEADTDVRALKKHFDSQNLDPKAFREKYSWFDREYMFNYAVEVLCQFNEFR